MLFAFEAGEKTEQPTAHRLREARRKGQVFKSMELGSALNIIGMMFLFMAMSGLVFRAFQSMFLWFVGEMLTYQLNVSSVQIIYRQAIGHYFSLAAPVFVAAILLGLASNLGQVGFLVSVSALAPRLERLNPLEGVKRIFSRRALFELVKALIKIAVIGYLSYSFIQSRLTEMLLLINQGSEQIAALFWRIMTGLGLRVGLAFLILALIDYFYQRYEHISGLKMSRKEVKDELKTLEGDPLVRSKIREKQRALARQRMLRDTAQANVVITNPTELAVALRYRESVDRAPKVLAKGAGLLAKRIREIARENKIELVENAPVARLLWQQTEVGDEIPLELYQAVAEILAEVYRMQEARSGSRLGAN
ncbi:MAG: flagellar biosynthesis protein FlhB [Dethiobacter sp.]|nr:flagellar biosynthesis protein FlhB [Dethiobacter sp.]